MYTEFLPYVHTTAIFKNSGFKTGIYSPKNENPPQHPLSPTFPLSPTPSWVTPSSVGCPHCEPPPCLSPAEENPTGASDQAPAVITQHPGLPHQPVPQWCRREPCRLIHEHVEQEAGGVPSTWMRATDVLHLEQEKASKNEMLFAWCTHRS